MIDFLMVSTRSRKRGVIEIYPKFIIKKSSDLMIRGGDFYAIWIEERCLWSTDEQDAIQLIDREIDRYAEEHRQYFEDAQVRVLHLWDAETGMIDAWHKYCQKQMRDSFHMLDEKIIFANTETTKKDYASKKLSYPLEKGDIAAYDKLMSTLYSAEERRKIEWAIGSIVSGDSKKLQKFMVLYGAAGTGKSTVLNIIQQLFDGYHSVFDAKALGSSSNSFALEAFKSNPLVAIQHDGDLSRIEDNTRLNSLVSHELMTVNEKFKSTYSNKFKCFLFMGTNKPVKITDAKSGLIRRLIDVSPSGEKLSSSEYKSLMKRIEFELGAIAYHCREVYAENPGYYDNYIPIAMLGASNDFYNFVVDSYHVFKREDGTTLKAAWAMYQTYCDEARVAYPYSQRLFKEELKNYFREFKERFNLEDGSRVRSYYAGFRHEKFDRSEEDEEPETVRNYISFNSTESVFDKLCAACPAQYANDKEKPIAKWNDVTTVLSDLDTSKVHYVRVPENHIVIDFDIPDENGEKSFELNLEAASKWPPTYAELSKSGAGIHLHYIYTGDPQRLSRVYDEHIEIKVFTGNSSLRRKLTKCNSLPIANISSGLPLKGERKMVNFEAVKSEKGLRAKIKRNLNKEIHASTKPSVDFIYKILEDAYSSGLKYDVTDMRNAILTFAANSTNQSAYCIKLVNKMKFKSEDISEPSTDDASIVFYDVEVFPNLFIVCWKYEGEDKPVVRMINPKPEDIEGLLRFKLVGFNCRRYDNHILYARLMGYTNEQLYTLSQRIIKGSANCFFGEAYNISYTDVYDFSSKKQSLKKFEIELGIHHEELGLPWDEPVPEEMWEKVAGYCDNDVIATEAVFNARKADFIAREILADVAGMTVNDTTNSLTTRIIFGKNRNPQSRFNYRDMGANVSNKNLVMTAEYDEYTRFDENTKKPIFPGYVYDRGVSTYRDEEVGEGGYVYAEPGMYGNVALLDIASMHPSSIVAENLFGDEYTQRFKEILDARILIKRISQLRKNVDDLEKKLDNVPDDTHRKAILVGIDGCMSNISKLRQDAGKMLDGALLKHLSEDGTGAKDLAQALKIAINSVYGLTSAKFDNPFRDPRNIDNIVAKRGALFMINLKHEVQKRGFTVAHIKTDSIKIPDATPEIIEFVTEYGGLYGYTFEHEATYEKMCLVNNAVYVAKYKDGDWTATGTQFQVPYVFKTLFSKEPIIFEDMCETKSVTTALYLDMNEGLPEDEHDYHFVGKVGQFCPIEEGKGGGTLLKEIVDAKTGKRTGFAAANGSKGFRWLESEKVRVLNKESDIERFYYDELVNKAVEEISEYGDIEWFVSDDPYVKPEEEPPT